MQDEILKRIDLLASKLNVAASHIYEVLIKQARVEAYQDIAWILLSLSTITGALYFILWCNKRSNAVVEDGIYFFGFVMAILLMIPCFIIFFTSFNTLLTELFNPEYFALHRLMEELHR